VTTDSRHSDTAADASSLQKDCCGAPRSPCTRKWPTCPATPWRSATQGRDCNGLVDDGLPTDPYVLEEDVTSVDDCAHAKLISTTVIENDQRSMVLLHLQEDLTIDGTFQVQHAGTQRLAVHLQSNYNECYTLTITLTNRSGRTTRCACTTWTYWLDVHVRSTRQQDLLELDQTEQDRLQYRGRVRHRRGFSYYLEVLAAGATRIAAIPIRHDRADR